MPVSFHGIDELADNRRDVSRFSTSLDRLCNRRKGIAIRHMRGDRVGKDVGRQLHDHQLTGRVDVNVLAIQALGLEAATGIMLHPPEVVIGVALASVPASSEGCPIPALANLGNRARLQDLSAIESPFQTDKLAQPCQIP